MSESHSPVSHDGTTTTYLPLTTAWEAQDSACSTGFWQHNSYNLVAWDPNYHRFYPNHAPSGCLPPQANTWWTQVTTTSRFYSLGPVVCPSQYTTALVQPTGSSTFIACCPSFYTYATSMGVREPGECTSLFSAGQVVSYGINDSSTFSMLTTTFSAMAKATGVPINGYNFEDVFVTTTTSSSSSSSSSTSSPSSTSPSTATSSSTGGGGGGGGLSTGATVGIAVGASVAGLLVIGAIAAFLLMRRRQHRQRRRDPSMSMSGGGASSSKMDSPDSGVGSTATPASMALLQQQQQQQQKDYDGVGGRSPRPTTETQQLDSAEVLSEMPTAAEMSPRELEAPRGNQLSELPAEAVTDRARSTRSLRSGEGGGGE